MFHVKHKNPLKTNKQYEDLKVFIINSKTLLIVKSEQQYFLGKIEFYRDIFDGNVYFVKKNFIEEY